MVTGGGGGGGGGGGIWFPIQVGLAYLSGLTRGAAIVIIQIDSGLAGF